MNNTRQGSENLYLPDSKTIYQTCTNSTKSATRNQTARNLKINRPFSGRSKLHSYQYQMEGNEKMDGQEMHLGH